MPDQLTAYEHREPPGREKFRIDGHLFWLPLPIPPENDLLRMLYEVEVNGQFPGFIVQLHVQLTKEDIQALVAAARAAKTDEVWKETPIPRSTSGT
jgi:hypothetical protein